MKLVVALWSLLLVVGCGDRPPQLGITVNEARIHATRIDTSPASLDRIRTRALDRTRHADVTGDDQSETLTAQPGGQGVEIRQNDGTRLAVPVDGYLTDFGTVRFSRSDKEDLVLYVYPVEGRQGRFFVMTPDGAQLARWDEASPPGRFVAGDWSGAPALFYITGDMIVIRSPDGRLLRRLPARGAGSLRDLHLAYSVDHGLVVVASGDGYTPYHMTAVYDAAGNLVFQEFGVEHAFAVEVNDAGFIVTTRSARWQYSPGGVP